MAKFFAPYTLCPLIEQRRFLGVSDDSSSSCVIVTLGKNIIVRYRLSDQKQVSSWSSKTKLSAPVVYDYAGKQYVGLFNSDEVGFWHDSLAQLNKIRKFKFTWLIHSILSSKDCPPVIVFSNGVIGLLREEFSQRKHPDASKQSDCLSGKVLHASLVCLSNEHYVVMTTSSKDEILHFCPVDPDRGSKFNVSLDREDSKLSAHTILEGDTPLLISFYKDGSLYSTDLLIKEKPSPGRLVGKVTCINPELPAAICPIGDQHIILYGASPSSEGAHLVILGLKFGLPEAIQRLKIYDEECRIWCYQNNILVMSGGHLVVVPYQMGTAKLVTLLGVGLRQVGTTSDEEVNDIEGDTIYEKIKCLKNKSLTDHRICERLLSKLIEDKDISGINDVLTCLKDIPDKWLVEIVLTSLGTDNALLRRVLSLPLVGDEKSLDLVRSKVLLPTALELLNFISKSLREDQGDKCLLEWATLLIDSHYQQYLLSKDDRVISAMNSMRGAIEEQLESMIVLKEVLAQLNSIGRGGEYSQKLPTSSHNYSVEEIKLY